MSAEVTGDPPKYNNSKKKKGEKEEKSSQKNIRCLLKGIFAKFNTRHGSQTS